jgi:hypothetical protein
MPRTRQTPTPNPQHGRQDAVEEACASVDERSEHLRSRLVVELARGARIESEGRLFAVLVRRAPTDQLRSLLLFAAGIALFATLGGAIFLGTAVFAAIGWTIDQFRRVEERVILRVDELGRVSVAPLPA